MSNYHIIPECYADTLLIEMLGFMRPNHQLSIGSVLNTMEKKFQNQLAVGIVDDDKQKPSQFKFFREVAVQSGIRKVAKPESRHTIFVICPAFEVWVFDNARQVDIDPARFGFSSIKYFRNSCKSQSVHRNQAVKDFLNTLKQKNAPGFVQLRTWIEELNRG